MFKKLLRRVQQNAADAPNAEQKPETAPILTPAKEYWRSLSFIEVSAERRDLAPLKIAVPLLRLAMGKPENDPSVSWEGVAEKLASGELRMAVALESMCVQAVATAIKSGEDFELEHWFVKPKHRGQKVGRKLLEETGLPFPVTPEAVQQIDFSMPVTHEPASVEVA